MKKKVKKTKKQKTLNEKLEALAKAAFELSKEVNAEIVVESNADFAKARIKGSHWHFEG